MALRHRFRSLWVAVVATAVFWVACSVQAETKDPRFITIGTGGVTGVYYPAGIAICRLVNRARKENGIRCSVDSTSGSIYNLNALRDGELDLAIVQSDWQYHAYTGTSVFKGRGPFKGLRSVLSLHSEPLTIVARRDSGIRKFADLKGKRVNIGAPGSGQQATLEVLMHQMGWTMNDFAQVSEIKPSEQSQALCDNRIDAFVYTVGHPSGAIKEATSSCDSVLVTVDNPAVRALVRESPYYSAAIIPGGMYRGNPKDVKTFGVRATLVTRADVPDEVIYSVVKAIFENFEEFKEQHPAFEHLEKKAMVSEGLSAPLHAGALHYYRQVGLLR